MYLNCKTFFSFRYGTYKTEDLVNAAASMGIKTLALTNINNTCDLWDFVEYCHKKSIKPVAGTEIRNDHVLLYILLAKNSRGLEQIHRFLSQHLQNKTDFPDRPSLEDVFVIYPFGNKPLNQLGSNEFVGIQTTEINKLFGLSVQVYAHKLVILQPVTFQDRKYYNAHRLLRAIDKNTLISKQDKKDLAGEHEFFLPPSQLIKAFEQYPDIIENTQRLLDKCSIEITFHTDKTKKVFTGSKERDKQLLEQLAMAGLQKRYGANHPTAKERVLKELAIIDKMNFNAYFLITWDITQYAAAKGFYYVGRGSGANSIIAYCLQITDVDPIELDLYFERFLNPHRKIPPDFDMDFSWKDRDAIIEYIFHKYGKEYVCLLGSYTTFQKKAILRELGKVFGLPKEEIDLLEGSRMKEDKIQQQIFYYASLLKDFPNHLSIHAGGMLISDEPIYQYTAVTLPPKGFATSQIDMFIAEKTGLFKLDILSQRGLGHIRETIELVAANKKETINIHAIEKFKQDENIARRIREADSIGCFYVESPGMRQLLKKLRCDDYITLVAASSIIRPGVSHSGMMKQYIYRFHHPQSFTYLHPVMKELLHETYGIMVYQEDVIKVAHHFAGLDMAEADLLRRAMNGKYRNHHEFENIRHRFFQNCKERNYDDTVVQEVWRQIESFGAFSFSKAHSASFAVESYQSLFLKTYYPMEFMVGVINNFGGFYSRELYFHELKKTGATIHPPCVNHSGYYTDLKGTDVRMGFIHVQGLEEQLPEQIIRERKKYGNYLNLQDFIERIAPGIEQLNILIRTGAFRFTGKNKKELLWEANFLQKKNSKHAVNNTLFREAPFDFQLPSLARHPLDDAMDEIELLGFPLCNVFDLVDDDTGKYIPAAELHRYLNQEVMVLGYLIVSKAVQTVKKETMYFHTFLDAAGDWLDVIVFPATAWHYPINGKGFYAMKGKVTEEFGVYSVEVQSCKKIGMRGKTNNLAGKKAVLL